MQANFFRMPLSACHSAGYNEPMRTTVPHILQMARKGDRIAMLTAYDYPSARLLDACSVPIILVGDSLGNVVLGYDSTLPVSMDEMIHHAAAVSRGTERAMVIGDMPFMSYQGSDIEAIHNAGRFLKEGGCQAVKLEGGRPIVALVRKLVEYGIPVMGHLGATPQSMHQMGGLRVQGRGKDQAQRMLEDALALEAAGAFSIVLELVPAQLARVISERLQIPTIGIGAGPHCDGQVLVFHDLLGLSPWFQAKHVKHYAELAETIQDAVRAYVHDVQDGTFPTEAQSHFLSPDEEALLSDL